VHIILRTSCLSPQLILADRQGVDELDALPCYVFYVLIKIESSVNSYA